MLKNVTFWGVATVLVTVSAPVLAQDFKWSQAGPISGLNCINIDEPADPHASWQDNYLCSNRDYRLQWSKNGPISGLNCVLFDEPADRQGTWFDNYLCSPRDLGLVFKVDGPAPNMNCVRIFEDTEPASTAWQDNYLCSPKQANIRDNFRDNNRDNFRDNNRDDFRDNNRDDDGFDNRFPLRGREVTQFNNQQRMETSLVVLENGRINGTTRLINRNPQQGFVGSVVVNFIDRRGQIIYTTQPKRFRVGYRDQRQEQWVEQLPQSIANRVRSYSILQSSASRPRFDQIQEQRREFEQDDN